MVVYFQAEADMPTPLQTMTLTMPSVGRAALVVAAGALRENRKLLLATAAMALCSYRGFRDDL
jgi:hypothetical protein